MCALLPVDLKHVAKEDNVSVDNFQANIVNLPAKVGFFACAFMFCAYTFAQFYATESDHSIQRTATIRATAITEGTMTLAGAMHGVITNANLDGKLLDISESDRLEVQRVLKPFFKKYNSIDGTKNLNRHEFSKVLRDLGENVSYDMEAILFEMVDLDKSGSIDFQEFSHLMLLYLRGEHFGMGSKFEEDIENRARVSQDLALVKQKSLEDKVDRSKTSALDEEAGSSSSSRETEGGESEEEEIPDDLQDLTPEQQQVAIKIRSLWLMGIGTMLVLVFSDPAVSVLNELGHRMHISPFYVSFVLAPLASNASELLAAYRYAKKKTIGTMTISLETLLGAAVMNNTFCLSIFYLLIWQQNLVWNFMGPVFSIVLTEWGIALLAWRPYHFFRDAVLALSLYPLSLLFVAGYEATFPKSQSPF